MRTELKKTNQVLAKDQAVQAREDLVLFIVNLNVPTEGWGRDAWETDEYHEFTKQLRERTEKYWPELWGRPSDNPVISIEERAWEIVRTMREYLRRFWSAADPIKTDEEIEHDRDWHIHRTREWWYSLEILPEVLKVDEGIQAPFRKSLLDKPPDRHSQIMKALYELQRRALKPSTAPKICRNPCENRYFLSNAKGEEYCPDCRRSQAARNRKSKLQSYHDHKDKWPSTLNRRKARE